MSRKIYTGVSDIKQYLIHPVVFRVVNGSYKDYMNINAYIEKNISGEYAISNVVSWEVVDQRWSNLLYRYYAFKENIDAMQFKLAFSNAQEVKMWQSNVNYIVFA